MRLHPHLTALDTLVSTVKDETGTQQVGLGLRSVCFPVQASLRKQQSSGVSPVVAVSLLSKNSVRVQGRMGALVPVKGHGRRVPVHLHAGVEILLHQGPQRRPRVAAPRVRPEGNGGEGLGLVHQRRQGFLRISWRKGTEMMIQ